eukprot:4676167-Pyramimonas_sp.AAC.1
MAPETDGAPPVPKRPSAGQPRGPACAPGGTGCCLSLTGLILLPLPHWTDSGGKETHRRN